MYRQFGTLPQEEKQEEAKQEEVKAEEAKDEVKGFNYLEIKEEDELKKN